MTFYLWKKTSDLFYAKLLKELGVSIFCAKCGSVLIDDKGRKRTNEVIWEYSIAGNILGHVHEQCAYYIEFPGTDNERVSDSENFGKTPDVWV